MNYVEWVRSLDRGALKPVYFCLVEEPYLWDSMKKVLFHDVIGEDRTDFNYECFRFADATRDRLQNAWETMPLFSEERVVVIEELPLERDSVKRNEELLDLVVSYIKNPNPTTKLFLMFRGLKPFSGKVVKAIKAGSTTVELGRLRRNELQGFILKRFKLGKVTPGGGAVDFVMEQSGYLAKKSAKTLYDVENEVVKALGAAKDGVLDRETLEEVLVSDFDKNIFRLLDTLSLRNLGLAMELFRGFERTEKDLMGVFYMFVRHYRLMIGIKWLKEEGKPDGEIMRRMGVGEFEYGKLRDASRRYGREELLALYSRLWEIETGVKTSRFDVPFALERFVVRACMKDAHRQEA